MNIQNIRDQFCIFLVSDSSSVLEPQQRMRQAGYEFHSVSLAGDTLEKIQETPPHVIFIDVPAVSDDPAIYIDQVARVSPESLIIAIVESVDQGLSLKGKIYDFLMGSFVRAETLLLMADKACERIFQNYKIEQLLERVEQGGGQKSSPEAGLAVGELLERDPLFVLIEDLKSVKEPGDFIYYLFKSFYAQSQEASPLLYFKLIAASQSLVVIHSEGIALEKVRGVGVHLAAYSEVQRAKFLRCPQEMPALGELLHKAFRSDSFVAYPMMINESPDGVIVKVGGFQTQESQKLFAAMITVTQVFIENRQLRFQLHNLQVFEPHTQLFNRAHFQKCLEEEMSRSRRTRMPVSLVSIGIDNYEDLRQSAGEEWGQKLLLAVAEILKKTSRITDIVADLTHGDFVLLLPHTDQKGAALKAEKVRRIVEKARFAQVDESAHRQVSLSLGVAEYPAVCSDADGLFKAADDALYFVKRAGGNRVCLAAQPTDFQPDFEPKAEL